MLCNGLFRANIAGLSLLVIQPRQVLYIHVIINIINLNLYHF